MSANVGRTLAVLAGLLVTLPVDAAITGLALLRGAPKPLVDNSSRTVLLTGGKMTKALQLARSFHRAGHRVILVESKKYRFTGHRFSNAVDTFLCVPEPNASGYAEALLKIVERENVDVFVPVSSPLASLYDAEAERLLQSHCEIMHVGADTVRKLDDKYEFSRTAASLGLTVPDTHRITDPQQVLDFDFPVGRKYVMKRLAYDPVQRLDLTPLTSETPERNAEFVRGLPISESNAWILQEFVTGQEYCTHSTVRDGRIQVYGCCESSAFQINYAMVDKPEIEKWVERFLGELHLTGQVSFDFIEAPDGQVYAIECNPRTHSAITMFHNHPGVAAAYLDDDVPVITPLPGARPTYWIYHELWRLATLPNKLNRLRIIASGKDAIFTPSDPLPYLMVHHLQIPSLLLSNLRHRRGWTRIDFNIGKLVEMGGD